MWHDVRAMFQILQYHNPLHFEYFEYRQGVIQREKDVIQKRFVWQLQAVVIEASSSVMLISFSVVDWWACPCLLV